MAISNERADAWESAVRAKLGNDLLELRKFGTTVNDAGRASGFYAVVRASAEVCPDLMPDGYGQSLALFHVIAKDGNEVLEDADFSDATAKINGVIGEDSERAFGMHMVSRAVGRWVDDSLGEPTLGAAGSAALVSRSVFDASEGTSGSQYFVAVSVGSPVLEDQANHHAARSAGRTYAEMVDDAEVTYQDTTANQLFASLRGGGTLTEALGERHAVAAAEAVGAALGIEYAQMANDVVHPRRIARPTPLAVHTTNFMRTGMRNGEVVVEVFSGTAPVGGRVLYAFDGTSNFGLVDAAPAGVAPVIEAPAVRPSETSFGLDFGGRSAHVVKKLNRTYTWGGKEAGVGSPVLAVHPEEFSVREQKASQALGAPLSLLGVKAALVVANNELDRPVAPGDVLM